MTADRDDAVLRGLARLLVERMDAEQAALRRLAELETEIEELRRQIRILEIHYVQRGEA